MNWTDFFYGVFTGCIAAALLVGWAIPMLVALVYDLSWRHRHKRRRA